MKLIFDDFPADLFNLIMHGEFYRATEKDYTRLMRIFNSCVIVKQEPKPEATPYEPKSDLISREDINSEIEKRYCSKHCVVPSEEPYCPDNCPARFLKNIVKECPSVPQVTVFTESTNEKAIEDMKAELQSVLDNERPQGEWYYGEDECGQDGWFCSKCGFFVPWYYTYHENDINFIREYKACPHCLAEMVTYTGKDRDTKGGE